MSLQTQFESEISYSNEFQASYSCISVFNLLIESSHPFFDAILFFFGCNKTHNFFTSILGIRKGLKLIIFSSVHSLRWMVVNVDVVRSSDSYKKKIIGLPKNPGKRQCSKYRIESLN